MALSTSRVCVPKEGIRLCPSKKHICPGGCKPGFCLNAQCLYHTRPEVTYCRPDFEIEADVYRKHIKETVQQQKNMQRAAFMASEKKQMGISEFEEGHGSTKQENSPDRMSLLSDGLININQFKVKECRRHMRPRARPSCMLDCPDICQTSDDYSLISLFTRTSTMPGYARNDTISETRDSHNMAVWNNRKEMDTQIYKLKRDWLSIWGEMNFMEQRSKKAWQDKLSADSGKR